MTDVQCEQQASAHPSTHQSSKQVGGSFWQFRAPGSLSFGVPRSHPGVCMRTPWPQAGARAVYVPQWDAQLFFGGYLNGVCSGSQCEGQQYDSPQQSHAIPKQNPAIGACLVVGRRQLWCRVARFCEGRSIPLPRLQADFWVFVPGAAWPEMPEAGSPGSLQPDFKPGALESEPSRARLREHACFCQNTTTSTTTTSTTFSTTTSTFTTTEQAFFRAFWGLWVKVSRCGGQGKSRDPCLGTLGASLGFSGFGGVLLSGPFGSGLRGFRAGLLT